MKNLFKILALVLALVFVFTSCKKKITPTPTPQVEDGMYVVGNSIFADSMQLANVMTSGMIEDGFDSKPREGLYYKFMYVTSAGDGFVIKQQKGSETIVWGLDGSLSSSITDTATVGNLVQDGVNFTVSKDGFYMLVVDFSTSKVFIYSVLDWGVVGDMNGWGGEPSMTQKSIDKENASWEITDVKMATGNKYKFRINHTWNYKIDDSAMVQSNFGGAIDALTQGGANIDAPTPAGYYTVTLNWNFATGFTASLTKTGDIAISDWTGIPMDLVGDGVSSDNTNAVADDIWSWGNKLQDDNGQPTNVGAVYTWTWIGVVIEADAGFKVRCNDTNLGFDIGDANVDATNSSANYVNDGDGNITMNTKASYDVTLTIDANNADAKTLVIADHSK